MKQWLWLACTFGHGKRPIGRCCRMNTSITFVPRIDRGGMTSRPLTHSSRNLAHRRDPRYGHRAEPRGLQSTQPCVYGGLGEARQRLKPEPLGGVRRAPDCPPAVQSGKNPAANIKSFMFSPLLSALVNITSIMKEHQAKPHGNLGPSLRRVRLGG